MNVKDHLIQSMLPGRILDVRVGNSRVAVLAETAEGLHCGMAAALRDQDCNPNNAPLEAVDLRQTWTPTQLADLVFSQSITEVAIGMAAINAFVPLNPEKWVEMNVDEYLMDKAIGKNISIVGHFPFVDKLRTIANNVWVLELQPRKGDLPAEEAARVIPQSDIVAITATTLINKTFDGLMPLCNPNAETILVGPSAPVTHILFDHGIKMVAGTIVTNPQAVLQSIEQEVTYHQLLQHGWVRLVTLKNDP